MPLPEPLTIGSGSLTARFSPRQGGRMTHLVHARHGDILVPMAVRDFDPWNWPKAGAYPLFPYHNRVIGGDLTHDGRQYPLAPHPALGADAMHGPAHRRPWAVRSHSDDSFEMALVYRADADWPFDFTAVQHFRLHPDRLDVELALRNDSPHSMPGGFAWHPYFAAGANRAMHSDAHLQWPLDRLDVPTGEAPKRRLAQTPLPSATYTIHLSDWTTASAVLDGGARICLTADAALPHLVVHRTSTYACLEPASHVAGAFGFPTEQRQAAGLIPLEPGQEIFGNLSLAILADR